MTFKNLLLISSCLVANPAASDVIKVSIVFGDASFAFPISGDVRLFRNGQELTSVARTKLEDESFEFDLNTCEDGMVFKVTMGSGFFVVEEEFYPCQAPEVQILASMSTFQTASAPTDVFTVDYSSVTYGSWIHDAVVVDPNTLAAMGSVAIENQAGLIAAMSQNNFGEAAFFANENAALARRAQLSSAAIGYAALSYDTGFRAMGIDPGGSTTPLIALDPSQGSIPVPTAEGLNFLRQYNTQIVEAPNANVWGFTTALSLRETGQAFEGSLLPPDSNGLSIDLQRGIFVRP